MRYLLIIMAVAGATASVRAQQSSPPAALVQDTVARTKTQAGTGSEVVKASSLRLDGNPGSGSRSSAAPAAVTAIQSTDVGNVTDEGQDTFRMLVAALLLMVAIALRRFHSSRN